MKKIIWIFGEVGSGKKTLVKKIQNNEDNMRERLQIPSDKIIEYDDPLNGSRQSTWDSHGEKKARIRREITSFMQSDDDILILMGDHDDIDRIFDNSLIKIATDYPDVEREIIFLEASDLRVQYERVMEEEWFQKDYERNKNRFPRVWLEIANRHLRKTLETYEQYGYKFTEIDTTDGYVIKNNSQKAK